MEKTLLKDVPDRAQAGNYALRSLLNNKTAVALHLQSPGATRSTLRNVRGRWNDLNGTFRWSGLFRVYDDRICSPLIERWCIPA